MTTKLTPSMIRALNYLSEHGSVTTGPEAYSVVKSNTMDALHDRGLVRLTDQYMVSDYSHGGVGNRNTWKLTLKGKGALLRLRKAGDVARERASLRQKSEAADVQSSMTDTTKLISFVSHKDRLGDTKVDGVLAVEGPRGITVRFGVGFVPEGSEGRQAFGGPMVPGPWAYTYGLCTVLAANPAHSTAADRLRNQANGLEHDVVDGDRVSIDGVPFVVRIQKRGGDRFVQLEKVED